MTLSIESRTIASRFEKLRASLIITWVVGTTLLLATGTAWAGMDWQGIDLHGTLARQNLGGAATANSSVKNGGLQGGHMTGFRLNGTGGIELLELVDFRGDGVSVLVQRDGHWRQAHLSPTELVGLTWFGFACQQDLKCQQVSYRIRSVARDTSQNTMPRYSANNDIWLYEVESSDSNSTQSGWRNVCSADRSGMSRGMFTNGRWRADGSFEPDGYTFACTSGVITKCVRNWGYKPWLSLLSDTGASITLAGLHRACTRAVRADYCGDGRSFTRDGTLIDLFDEHGFNVRDGRSGFVREATFTVHGARSVSHLRWPGEPIETQVATCLARRGSRTAVDDVIHVWSRRR